MRVTGDSSGGMTTISGLNKATVYTVEVAAETRAGTRVYSLPLIIQTPDSEGTLHHISILGFPHRCLPQSEWCCHTQQWICGDQ